MLSRTPVLEKWSVGRDIVSRRVPFLLSPAGCYCHMDSLLPLSKPDGRNGWLGVGVNRTGC
jgi:hypothetical protein